MPEEIRHLPLFDKYDLDLIKETTEVAKQTNTETIIKNLAGHIVAHGEFVYCLYESKPQAVKQSIMTVVPGFDYEFWHVDTYGNKAKL